MRRVLIGIALVGALAAAGARAQDAPPESVQPSVGQRIHQSLIDAGETATLRPMTDAAGLGAALGETDASLVAPTGSARLRTPLESADIEQRIDKGLTAAGEDSALRPDYAYGAFQRGWFLTAFSLALDRARSGDAVAQTLLGELLSRGLGVKQDLAAAADWYRLAADRGDAEALYALGRLHLEGRGVKQDFEKAADLFENAAEQGHGVAARELAYLLLQGKGRERDAMLAAAYMRRAAAGGDVDAQYALAGLYVEGVGVVGDPKLAARWFGAAAQGGHVGAQVEYAIQLFNGRGVTRNEALAARWFAEAARADNPLAQSRLARLYAEGRGVTEDPAEAARWHLIAKARGVQDSFMEDWLDRQDPAIRSAAAEAAENWADSRRGWMQAAAPGNGAVDKNLQ
jgi:TPR repeat protein